MTGLSLSKVLPNNEAVPFTAIISGTPTVLGAYAVTYRNDDGIGATTDLALNFNVISPSQGVPPGSAGLLGLLGITSVGRRVDGTGIYD